MKTITRLLPLGLMLLLCQGCVTSSSSAVQPPSEEDAAIANLNLGIAYLRQGRPELALERLERALSQNPRLADVHSAIALAYDQLGEVAESETHYQRATQLEPDNAAAANSYAVFLCRNNRWEEAERYFRRAADNPRYATPEAALTNAGVCARGVGQTAKAEEYFREALMRNPAFPDALYNMTDLAFQSENYLQARAFAQRYLDSGPASPQLFWLCFQIEQELGNEEVAQRCATQLRDQFPESAEVSRLHQLERDARQ